MEMKNLIPNFWDWDWELSIQLTSFGILNGNEKSNSQLLGLGMGMKNCVPNQTWEIIYKKVSGKS